MRLIHGLIILLASSAAFSGCKQKTTSSRPKAQPVKVAQGTGNGLKLTGTGFVWEKAELPICFAERAGVKFFVWKEQSTFACEKGKKDWQLVAKKKG